MPLTPKGKKIMASMRKQYGSEKGEEVFYASKNKGTIKGVEKTEETKPMSYIQKLLEMKRDPAKANEPDGPKTPYRSVSGGKTGDISTGNRLIKPGPSGRRDTGKATRNIKSRVSQYTAGPKGKLPGKREDSSTEYRRIGALMAEALGYRVDELAFLAPLATGAAKMAGKYLAKKAAVGAAKKAAGALKKPEKPEEKEMEESIWNLYRNMAIVLAEAFAGPIASKYGEKRMKSGGTEGMKDPQVKAGAKEAQKRVDKRLGVSTNLRAKDAVQAAMNKRRAEARKSSGGSSDNLTPGDKKALAQRDVDLRSGDK